MTMHLFSALALDPQTARSKYILLNINRNGLDVQLPTSLDNTARNLTAIRNQHFPDSWPAILSQRRLRDEERLAERRGVVFLHAGRGDVDPGHLRAVRRLFNLQHLCWLRVIEVIKLG